MFGRRILVKKEDTVDTDNDTSNNAFLKLMKVSSLHGDFVVPDYQRGYRWSKIDVERLLDDVYMFDERNDQAYCLQPVVVKRNQDESFELIDGQQRLTTLFLIYSHMHARNPDIDILDFRIRYVTRPNSEEFLSSLSSYVAADGFNRPGNSDTNIDFFFMCEAMEAIDDWFSQTLERYQVRASTARQRIAAKFDTCVQLIWYEVPSSEDGNKMFTRLNIGKIPLTNAELVKALFLSQNARKPVPAEMQQEIVLQWDSMETQLRNESLWGFLVGKPSKGGKDTRIDLVLDLVAENAGGKNDKYWTFYRLQEMAIKDSPQKLWESINRTFLNLRGWFEDSELYHKIGYLIASGSSSIASLYKTSAKSRKSDFVTALNRLIKESVQCENVENLSYGSGNAMISKILLLFNILSVMRASDKTQRFPFDKFRTQLWSLEHIHAQQSQIAGDSTTWKQWLELHLKVLDDFRENQNTGIDQEITLRERMKAMIEAKAPSKEDFIQLQEEVFNALSDSDDVDYLDGLANLALLNCGNNSALGNSVFAVKRDSIIDMDKRGEFIPFCTRMVFLKYYSRSKDADMRFWTEKDRQVYIAAIKEVLKDYLAG